MKIKSVFFAVLLAAGALFAQQGEFWGPPMDGLQTDQLKTFLSLSNQQVQDLINTMKAFREAASPIMQKIAEKARALREASRQNPVDQALVAQLQAELDSLRKDEQNLRAQYRLQAQNVLTAQQKASLANLEQVLSLLPTAHQAVALNLLDGPGPFPGGRGGRGGPGSPGGGGFGNGRPRIP